MKNIKEAILDVFLPRYCIGCRKEGYYICEDCEIFLSEVPVTDKHLFTVWGYEGIVEKAIRKIKHDGTYHILEELTEKALERVIMELPGDACVTFVPMHKRREKQIGFNPAELIARRVGQITKKEVVPLLEKTKDSRIQAGLDIAERTENVKGTFNFTGPFRHQNVLLVDDFCASGATIKECERVLRENGVKNVWGFTLAKSNH